MCVVIRICPVQLWKPRIKVHSPCTLPTLSNSTSAKAFHLPLFIIQNWGKPGLCALYFVDCEGMKVPSLRKQMHIEGDSFEPVDRVQSSPPPPPATFVITLNKQPLSPPVHEAFRRWTEENSRVSEYLGQHGILDLSENTRLSLSPSLTHSHKHTTTHTPHTHTVVVNTQLACSRVQMVYNLQPSKRNWAAPVSWNLSPSSCFKC